MDLSHDERKAIHEWLVPLVSFMDHPNPENPTRIKCRRRLYHLLETWYDEDTNEELIFEAETIAGVI